MYNEIDDKEMFMINSAKRKIKKDEYENFCKLIKTPTRLENTQKMYYNKYISGKSVASNIKVKNNEILSDIMSKNWTDTYKRKVLKVYNDFEKQGYITDTHFLTNYLERCNKNKYKKISFDNVISLINQGKTHIQEDGRFLYFSEEMQLLMVQNEKNNIFITFIRRKNAKKGWKKC